MVLSPDTMNTPPPGTSASQRLTVEEFVNELVDSHGDQPGLASAIVDFLNNYDNHPDHIIDARDYDGGLAYAKASHSESTLEIMRASNVDLDLLALQIREKMTGFIQKFDDGDGILQPLEAAHASAAIARVLQEVPDMQYPDKLLYDAAHRGEPAQPYLTNRRILDQIDDALKHGLPDSTAPIGDKSIIRK